MIVGSYSNSIWGHYWNVTMVVSRTSAIYNMYRNGPRTMSCGTPALVLWQSDNLSSPLLRSIVVSGSKTFYWDTFDQVVAVLIYVKEYWYTHFLSFFIFFNLVGYSMTLRDCGMIFLKTQLMWGSISYNLLNKSLSDTVHSGRRLIET